MVQNVHSENKIEIWLQPPTDMLVPIVVALSTPALVIRSPSSTIVECFMFYRCALFYWTSNLPDRQAETREKYIRDSVLGFSWKWYSDISPISSLFLQGGGVKKSDIYPQF